VKIPVQINNTHEYQKAEREFIAFLREKLNSGGIEIENELKTFAKKNKIEISNELSEKELNQLKIEKIKRASTAPVLSQIEILKQLSVKGKLNSIINWIQDFLESGEKLVIFTIHRNTIDVLFEKFKDISVKIDGSVTMLQRQKAVDQFQNNPFTRLFIGNMKAAGTGITLTAASNALMTEFPWSPGELTQASDRIHRITQTKQVTIYNMVGVNTIEERIIDLLKKKEHVINRVLDGKIYKESSILNDLVMSYIK
ncbi:MAG: C-terminal helicase domain-containing protein, partial [Bacteroidales bacterium]|nr:C-terminal helicase domain-containing protein [Bacteroidales bacterium]